MKEWNIHTSSCHDDDDDDDDVALDGLNHRQIIMEHGKKKKRAKPRGKKELLTTHPTCARAIQKSCLSVDRFWRADMKISFRVVPTSDKQTAKEDSIVHTRQQRRRLIRSSFGCHTTNSHTYDSAKSESKMSEWRHVIGGEGGEGTEQFKQMPTNK